MKQKIITVFGSSRPKPGETEYEYAYKLGKALGKKGLGVCTGGHAGIMEAVSKGASEEKVPVIGVTVKGLRYSSVNKYLTEKIEMPDLLTRIDKLIQVADAYVVLKGGTGTLAELGIVWEYVNKGFAQEKKIVLAHIFWQPIIDMFIDEKNMREHYDKNGAIRASVSYLHLVTEIEKIVECVAE